MMLKCRLIIKLFSVASPIVPLISTWMMRWRWWYVDGWWHFGYQRYCLAWFCFSYSFIWAWSLAWESQEKEKWWRLRSTPVYKRPKSSTRLWYDVTIKRTFIYKPSTYILLTDKISSVVAKTRKNRVNWP